MPTSSIFLIYSTRPMLQDCHTVLELVSPQQDMQLGSCTFLGVDTI